METVDAFSIFGMTIIYIFMGALTGAVAESEYPASTWIILWPLIILLYLLKGILYIIISSLLGLYSICRDGLNSFVKDVQRKIREIKRS